MNLHTIDWLIVFAFLAVLLAGAAYTTRFTRSVSAFLAAERCGGRYLIAMALAMAGTGVISLVYWFEIYYEAGFAILRFDGEPRLDDISIPTLNIIPTRDQLIPANLQRRTARQLADNRVVEIEGARHEAVLTHPLEVAKAIRDFVA